MASKRNIRRKSCEGKQQYGSLSDAIAASRKAVWRTDGDAIHAYKCRFCGHWHIGHPPAKNLRAMRARREGRL